MTDEEKRFDRREEARLDDMYDAQYEVDTAFNRWWNADGLIEDNPFNRDTPAFWAWEGWQAALKSSVMTDEEYEQAMADEGQRRMLSFDNDVRALIKEAVEAEREACAKVCDEKVEAEYATGKVDHNEMGWTQSCAIAIRARGDALAKLNQAAEDNGEPL